MTERDRTASIEETEMSFEQFTIARQVQFAETDMAGVMHFSNYFRLMEEVEHAWWRSLGLSVFMTDESRPKLSWPRVNVSCEYAAPARFEDRLELRHCVTRVGEKSVEQEVAFFRDGKQIALGRMTVVCCAMTKNGFKAISIPAEIREKIGPKSDQIE